MVTRYYLRVAYMAIDGATFASRVADIVAVNDFSMSGLVAAIVEVSGGILVADNVVVNSVSVVGVKSIDGGRPIPGE